MPDTIHRETRPRLSTAAINKIQPGEILWDSAIPGFGCRCQVRAKVFMLQYRFKGRTRVKTIGRYGAPWTLETARVEARRLLGALADGIDPAEARDHAKTVPQLSDLARQFLAEHVAVHLKPQTRENYRSIIELFVIPNLGHYRIDQITSKEVEALHRKMASKPFQANRTLAVLSSFFNWTERLNLRAQRTNPAKLVKKYKERARDGSLSASDITKLHLALDLHERMAANIYSLSLIRVLLLTGARLNEIRTLKWEFVDIEAKYISLPDSKTGPRRIYLNDPAIAVLNRLPHQHGSEYVFPGTGKAGHLVNVQKPWRAIRKSAGLSRARIHDLRHTFASQSASQGTSLAVIGKLLGHKSYQTTSRYAKVQDEALRAANAKVGEVLKQTTSDES